ncbi:MAG: hypothetical protein C4520_21440 [Candidatus Abyssobacteria bacterium SURF_5]|uniref:Uncharacterized protein n=1 Tax=Abyssobacteria bacterium (strain SURF_5) TaxID=2093360 RepID=A0A3A4NCW7_ABYX5|nr:MAG: hypothetical protein C4520_21440 [Candidatus Abyssubacteria bacterium SURF_5]
MQHESKIIWNFRLRPKKRLFTAHPGVDKPSEMLYTDIASRKASAIMNAPFAVQNRRKKGA